jgi:Fe-S-cluster containining protein
MSQTLRENVIAASQRPEVAEAIERLYAELQLEIDARRPLCVISGRCCKFDEYGHRLYVTTLELATFVRRRGDAPIPDASDPGSCPFQSNKLCGVHAIRPFGCRMFFCDATATDWQQAAYERYHAKLKQLHEELAVPYAYVEWRAALGMLSEPD